MPPRKGWRGLLREEAGCWGHALRTASAASLALWIALRLDLGAPGSAAMTAVLVSLPTAGQSLEKSLARLLGTAVGAGVALLLVMALAPERDLFILALSAWLAICVAGSAWYRQKAAYAGMLMAITACFVGLPGFQAPERAFDLAVDRLTVISIGVICGGLATALVFPRASRDDAVAAVRAAFRDFVAHASRCLAGQGRRSEAEVLDRHFVRQTMNLESARISTAFEEPELARTRRLDGFISAFMLSSTTARAVEHLRADLRARGQHAVLAALHPVAERLLAALRVPGERAPASAAEAAPVAETLDALAARWGAHADEARGRLGTSVPPVDRLALDGALALLRQLVRESRELARTYADLRAPPGGAPLPARPLWRRPDTLGAAVAGLRAAFTFLVVCALWILTAFPDGEFAATTAAVGLSVFQATPRPVTSTRRELIGYVLVFPIAFAACAFVLPAMQGFPLLVAGLAPFLLVAGYLTARPATAAFAWPVTALFFMSLRITERTTYDVGAVMNTTLAAMLGIAVPLVSFAVVLPSESRVRAALLERALTRQLRAALGRRRSHSRHRFEAAVRDLTLELADLPGANADERRRRVLHGIRVLEAGHAALSLAALSGRGALRAWSPEIGAVLEASVRALESRRPGDAARALAALEALGARVDAAAAAAPRATLVALRTSGWLLRLAVEEHAGAPAAGAGAPTRLPEVIHAA
ncbi:FUSC family protein [Anaeromyxobacter soli]|uniref:FUSC family protein n=1 Tax=Anaeromyxobacter soli TaxID=2922725 RepID=UPI001FAFEADC|nr:FUSC family protein [Anaeromyxobacter sp. SG29]